MVRILIVEDQKIMQKYFEYIIMQEPEFDMSRRFQMHVKL